MKKKAFSVLLLVCVFLLGWLLWWYNHGKLTDSLANSLPATPSKTNKESKQIYALKEMGKQVPGGPFVVSDPRWKRVEELEKTDKQWEWKTQIEFYGMVVDEKDQPVSGAQIHFVWNDISAAGSSEKDTTSDGTGLFSLSGVRGKGLSVAVQKSGYYTAQKGVQRDFEYAAFWDEKYHQPNAKSPVVFRLREKGQTERMVYNKIRMPLSRKDKAGGVDLISGNLNSSGDLRVQIWNSQTSPPSDRFDWKITLNVANGGLIEFNDEFPFEAPNDGYQSSLDVVMNQSRGRDWKRNLQKTYFIKYGQPSKFGRLNLEAKGDGETVFIDCWINPSGSRNLEYDVQ